MEAYIYIYTFTLKGEIFGEFTYRGLGAQEFTHTYRHAEEEARKLRAEHKRRGRNASEALWGVLNQNWEHLVLLH